jgi:hypothetical protein
VGECVSIFVQQDKEWDGLRDKASSPKDVSNFLDNFIVRQRMKGIFLYYTQEIKDYAVKSLRSSKDV